MVKQKIKALIFDVGGVLFLPKDNGKEKHLLSSFKEACLFLGEFGINAEESFKNLRNIYLDSSRGKISKEKTLNLMSKELGVPQKRLEGLFEKIYRDNTIENKELYDYVIGLKKEEIGRAHV